MHVEDGLLNYPLKIETELIGDLSLRIQSLADLNHTIDELFAMLERGGNPELLETLCPYFGVVWPAARGLAEHLAAAGPGSLGGKKVLEVGCGLALPSLVAVKLGASVMATDFHPDIPRFLARNLALNSIEGLSYVSGNWQHPDGALGTHDWVIGSDILYEKQHPAPVARMLARHVAPGGKIVLADPGRPYLQAFADEMRSLGFSCHVTTRSEVFILDLHSLPNRIDDL